jgi:hypothetical protein
VIVTVSPPSGKNIIGTGSGVTSSTTGCQSGVSPSGVAQTVPDPFRASLLQA